MAISLNIFLVSRMSACCRPLMKRLYRVQRVLYGMACGGITLGILQGFEGIRFGEIIAALLVQFFSAIVALFLGGGAGFAV